MSRYEDGYDPKLGYNRNAYAHGTPITRILGKTVKLIGAPIGLASEAIHSYKDKKRSQSNPHALAAAGPTLTNTESRSEKLAPPSEGQEAGNDSTYVNIPADQADHLIASGQAVPAEDQEPTHALVPEDDKDEIEGDEADWALDEAAATEEPEPSPHNEDDPIEPVEDLIKNIRPAKGGSLTSEKPASKLPFPVILPQRRPGTKARGFVRAYAPVLEECGIDQEMFLSFLKNFHKAAQASPIFDVIIIGTAIAGFYPDILVGLSIQAVQIAAAIGQEIQERLRTNRFLDQANKEIFIPRGLFALLVAYKPSNPNQPDVGTERVDLGATAMAKYGDALLPEKTDTEEVAQEKKRKMDEMKEKMKNLRIVSGETHGEAEMPVTCAPLIFPALDAVAESAAKREGDHNESVAETIKAKSKDTTKFVNNYFDRRAQAVYAINNPNSTLTTQVTPIAPQFKSRFADPTNATNMHLFSLLTGGRYKAEPLGAKRRWQRAQRKEAKKRTTTTTRGVAARFKKRLLGENVVYLMVVRMPTRLELEKARKEVKEVREGKGKKGERSGRGGGGGDRVAF